MLPKINARALKASVRRVASSKKAVVGIVIVAIIGTATVGYSLTHSKKKTASSGSKTSKSSNTRQTSKDSPPATGSDKSSGSSKEQIGTNSAKDHSVRQREQLKRKLEMAVKNKQLTQEKADKIYEKSKDYENIRSEIVKLPSTERTKVTSQKYSELREWAKQNNIPTHWATRIFL